MTTPTDMKPQGASSAQTATRKAGLILFCRDIGENWPKEQFDDLKAVLEQRLACLVTILYSVAEPEIIADEIDRFARQGVNEITLLPASQLPLRREGTIGHVINWTARHWPTLTIQIGQALRWIEVGDWINSVLQSSVKQLGCTSESSAVLLYGAGSDDSLRNAELARMSQLLNEKSAFFRISWGFSNRVRPSATVVLESLEREPVQNILIVPWQQGELDQNQDSLLASSIFKESGKSAHIVKMKLTDSSFLNLLVANYLGAVTVKSTGQSKQGNDETVLSDIEEFELKQLRSRIDELLPSEYQGRFEDVSPRSMGTAKLQTDDAGQVAWDQIWTSFCDLALAGGPPHRGKLLEAVTSEEAMADLSAYQLVVNEIRRGIGLVTHLPTFESSTLGWVGIRCDSEEMAVWLMRAIIVENVMVRREGDNLFLPAGPKFTVAKEIKNVITSVAKTVHYWQAHLKSRRKEFQDDDS